MGAAVAAATAAAAAALASGLGPPDLPNPPPPASGDLFLRPPPSPPPPPPRCPLLLLLGGPQPPALSWLAAARPSGLPPRCSGPLPSRWCALLELLLRCRLPRCTGAPMGDTGTGEPPYGRRCITGWIMAEVTTGW